MAGSRSYDYLAAGIRPVRETIVPLDEATEWTSAAAQRRGTLKQAMVINELEVPVFVRFYATDESLACRKRCVNKTLGPLSPLYKMPPRSRMQMLYEVPSTWRPDHRVRMYWRAKPDVLGNNFVGFLNVDNLRADNLDPDRDYNVDVRALGNFTS